MNAISVSHSNSITQWVPASPLSITGSKSSSLISEVFDEMKLAQRTQVAQRAAVQPEVDRHLSASSTAFKVLVSQVSMHLGLAWLQKLFAQVDSLLDVDEWDPRDPVPSQQTSRTFIRLLLALSVSRKPGLGVSHSGNLVAAWTSGRNRLTVECLASDRVKWVVNREINGETERAAGEGKIERLREMLGPYQPSIWFEYAE